MKPLFRNLTPTWLFGLLLVLLLVLMVLAIGIGAVHIPAVQTISVILHTIGFNIAGYTPNLREEVIITQIRLPRVLMAASVGSGLGIAGAAMQGVFRNPLAEPGLVGVSAGALLGAVAFVVFGDRLGGVDFALHNLYWQPLCAFGTGLVCTALVYKVSAIGGRVHVVQMLLAGIAINALVGALVGLMIFVASDQQIRTINFWTLGTTTNASWQTVLAIMPFVGGGLIFLPTLGRALNVLLLGEAEAYHLGIHVERLKRMTILAVTLTVGACVAFTGLIGFIGLIAPHAIRLLVGPDHRVLLPASALFGAVLLVAADIGARTLVAPAEMPIGILTALLGAPFFLALLMWQVKENRL